MGKHTNKVYMTKFKVPIFEFFVRVHYSKTLTAFEGFYDITSENSKDYAGFAWRLHNGSYDLVVTKKANSLHVHEIVHVVNMFFKDYGIKPDLQNDELQAYMTEWLYKKITKAISKMTGDNKKRYETKL
jgi:hypothetical protein